MRPMLLQEDNCKERLVVKGFCCPRHHLFPLPEPSQDREGLLTVSGLFLIHAFVLVLGVDVFCLCDPVQVAFQVLFQLLLLSQLLEISSSLGLLPLFGELSAERVEWTGQGSAWMEGRGWGVKERWERGETKV